MFQKGKLCFFHVRTPLHAGSGQDLGLVDLPIQRERHTGWPKIEGSGVKGSLREVFQQVLETRAESSKKWIDLVFGPEEDGNDHAGALGFSDARILLFPVKSMKGVFAYTTCPAILKRLIQDLEALGSTSTTPSPPGEDIDKALLASKACLIQNKIVLEEYALDAAEDNAASEWGKWLAEKTKIPEIQKRLVILPNDDFRDFVELATEVITRTKIDSKTGTVATGALFTEEFLPAESVLYTLVLASTLFYDGKERENKSKEFNSFLAESLLKNGSAGNIILDKNRAENVLLFFETLLPSVVQMGGNATLGKGLVRTILMEEK
ncbi:MAG: type III-B CRISPR module RAMP protein Cmr4 [Planctomycetota bacterium]|nr:MAG: type III-B CRISPR module RAMP protein Cmr4 [Planctomycetota bacterium]